MKSDKVTLDIGNTYTGLRVDIFVKSISSRIVDRKVRILDIYTRMGADEPSILCEFLPNTGRQKSFQMTIGRDQFLKYLIID